MQITALPVWRVAMWSGIGLVSLLPLVAMQVTRDVAWTGFDFAMAAPLLIGGGVAYEVTAGGAILIAILVIWAEGAVGIF